MKNGRINGSEVRDLTDVHGKQITGGGEFKEPEANVLEESSMCKSALNAQAQEIILGSEQQMILRVTK